jgi:hypothetical protein
VETNRVAILQSLNNPIIDGGKVFSLKRWSSLLPRRFLVLAYVSGCQPKVHSAAGRIR